MHLILWVAGLWVAGSLALGCVLAATGYRRNTRRLRDGRARAIEPSAGKDL